MADDPGPSHSTGTTSPSSPSAAASLPATTSTTSSAPAQPFLFMDLPVELRIQIHEHVVVVGRVFSCLNGSHDHDVSHDAYHRPSLYILRMSTDVHNEAEEVYLTKELFILPDRSHERMSFIRGEDVKMRVYDQISGPLFPRRGLQVIKHIYVDVSADYLPPRSSSYWKGGNPGLFDEMTQKQRYQEVHHLARSRVWEESSNSFDTLCSETKALTTVELDFAKACCATGCC